MKSPYLLRNEKESAIGVTMIEELKAEYQAVFLTIRILDQIASKLWSNHRTMALRGFVYNCHNCKDEKGLTSTT